MNKKDFKEAETKAGITAQTTARERRLKDKEFAKLNPGDTSGCTKEYEYREGDSHQKKPVLIRFKKV